MKDVISQPVARMFEAFAELFDAEGRPGGDEAAAALRASRFGRRAHGGSSTRLDAPIAMLTAGPGPEAVSALRPMLPHLPWHYSGLEDGRIRPEISKYLATCEVLGSRGIVDHPTVRVGLFFQGPNIDYVERVHGAEETFVMLAGTGEWRRGAEAWRGAGVGDEIHHPSMLPHQSRTGSEGFLALWRWTGDIRISTYELRG
ncbi:MAG: dimethylsulfonioproprionate lyase family protein [Pseudomonadota bacterium]